MSEKKHVLSLPKETLESDRKLIKVLFEIEPLDFARRDDGTLVIIHPDGKKTTHTPEELDQLSNAVLARRSAAMLREAQRQSNPPPAGKKPSAAASRPPAAPASERASREASGDARLSAASGRSTGGPTAAKEAADAGAEED